MLSANRQRVVAHRKKGVARPGCRPLLLLQPAMRICLLAGLLGALTLLTSTASAQTHDDCAMVPDQNASQSQQGLAASPTALRWMPTTGSIRALVVFIKATPDNERTCVNLANYFSGQNPAPPNTFVDYDTYCATNTPGYQSNTEDPATEWPAFNSSGAGVLPAWASRFIDAPGTAPQSYQRGSLSHFFWEMSAGNLRYEGIVYPELIEVNYPNLRTPANQRDAAVDAIAYINANPHGIDFNQFDRYINGTDQYGPDTNGDGEPDGDGVFDQLILVARNGQGVACFGTQGYACNYSVNGGQDGFVNEGLPAQFLGSKRVRSSFRDGSGSYTNGFTLGRAVSVAAHEVGHTMLSFHTCGNNTAGEQGSDLTSIMCGPRQRSMNAPDRIKLGWLTPTSISASALSQTSFTLSAKPLDAQALWIHGPGGSASSPAAGDVLVEARTFSSAWDGVPELSDGDFEDVAPIPHEGLLVFQYNPNAPTSAWSGPDSFFSSMDNTGVLARRDVNGGTLEAAAYFGTDPPHRSFTSGDVFSPLSRFRFAFWTGSLDSRVALTNIVPSTNAVSFSAWDYFLTASADRAVSTNYTLANHAAGTGFVDDRNRARTDDFTFGGTLRLGGTHGRIFGGTPSIILQPGSRLVVASMGNVALWGPNNYTFPVTAGAGARVDVYGSLHAERASFSASNPTDGWSGIFIGPDPFGLAELSPGPESELKTVAVSGVRFVPDPEVRYLYPPGGAVMVQNRVVRIRSGSSLSGSVFSNGLYVTGSQARVTVNGNSEIEFNDGFGVLAMAGGRVTVTGGASVAGNLWGGIQLNGYGTRATLDGAAQVVDNAGAGLVASNQAHASVRSPGGSTNTSVSDNNGGPTALAGGSVDGGQCRPLGGATGPNRFEDNYLGFYDARAEGGSTVAARDAYWGPGRTALTLVVDKSSTIDVFPLAPTPTSTPSSSCYTVDVRTTQPSSLTLETHGAVRGGGAPSLAVVALATEARQAAWAGDFETAFDVLDQAAQAAVTEDDREAVFEATAALLADERPATVVATLQTEAAGTGDARPWARRALAVAYASGGDPDGADALAISLVTEDAGTAHALFGHGLRVRLAVEADSAEMAFARLADLEAIVTPVDTAAVETFGAALALVVAAFPDAVDAGARTASASAQAAMVSSATVVGAALDGVAVWPNPAAGRVSVQVSLSTSAATARATVYDVLGRQVAVLHDGPLTAGAHPLGFDAASLAPGLYVVRVAVTPETGARWTETRRVTVTR